MDGIQTLHEQSVGDAFVAWMNHENGTHFVFDTRPHDAPDLRYVDGEETLSLEITDAYYDNRDARMRWQAARNDNRAPHSWHGVNFDRALADAITERIREKCLRDYGAHCTLVVHVSPALTSGDEMEQLLGDIELPAGGHFAGVYLTGDFPAAAGGAAGFRCWQLR